MTADPGTPELAAKPPAPLVLGGAKPLTASSLEAFMRVRFSTMASDKIVALGCPSARKQAEIMAEPACFL